MHTIVTSILEVFLFDPLFIWAIQPSPFTRQHNNTKANINSQAQAALYNVQKKNMGYLHQYTLTDDDLIELNPMCVSTLVDRLFRQATSQERLCRMFVGWAPWL
jgi:phosphatidylinositol kinase/protein kinase (PI-3  family)